MGPVRDMSATRPPALARRQAVAEAVSRARASVEGGGAGRWSSLWGGEEEEKDEV